MDIKAPTESVSVQEVAGAVHIHGNEQGQTWVIWITDKVFVVGSDKTIVELITAFLVKDVSLVKQICKELSIDPKFIFGEEYASITFSGISVLALNTGSIFGITRGELFHQIKKGGKKGRIAVRQFFSELFQQKGKTKEISTKKMTTLQREESTS